MNYVKSYESKPRVMLLHRTIQQGYLHLQNYYLDRAIECFHKVIRWLPKNYHANLQLGYIYLHMGDLERSRRHTNIALETESDNILARAQLIAILIRWNDDVSVTKAQMEIQQLGLPLDKIIEISKSVLVPPHQRIESLIEILNQKNLINTEIAARLFIENYPYHPLGWQVLGEALHDTGQYDEALEIKRATAEKFPKDANVFNNLARTLLDTQDYEGAKANAEKALNIDPQHKNAVYHLMKARLAIEQIEQGVVIL